MDNPLSMPTIQIPQRETVQLPCCYVASESSTMVVLRFKLWYGHCSIAFRKGFNTLTIDHDLKTGVEYFTPDKDFVVCEDEEGDTYRLLLQELIDTLGCNPDDFKRHMAIKQGYREFVRLPSYDKWSRLYMLADHTADWIHFHSPIGNGIGAGEARNRCDKYLGEMDALKPAIRQEAYATQNPVVIEWLEKHFFPSCLTTP